MPGRRKRHFAAKFLCNKRLIGRRYPPRHRSVQLLKRPPVGSCSGARASRSTRASPRRCERKASSWPKFPQAEPDGWPRWVFVLF